MREHRLYSPQALRIGEEVALDESASRHALQALRLKTGASITLFDGSGDDYAAVLTQVAKRSAMARIEKHLRSEAPSPLHIELAIGISRGERMDFSLQKAVELGVNRISPLFTERTQVQLKGERVQNRLAHWQGVIRHACEQSGRSRLPELTPPQALNTWLQGFNGSGLLLDHRAQQTLPTLTPPSDGKLSLLVGPEGGLSENERDMAQQFGLTGIRMGPRVLRTETAPLAALAAIQTLWGDFRA